VSPRVSPVAHLPPVPIALLLLLLLLIQPLSPPVSLSYCSSASRPHRPTPPHPRTVSPILATSRLCHRPSSARLAPPYPPTHTSSLRRRGRFSIQPHTHSMQTLPEPSWNPITPLLPPCDLASDFVAIAVPVKAPKRVCMPQASTLCSLMFMLMLFGRSVKSPLFYPCTLLDVCHHYRKLTNLLGLE
jgi:hypothetical protein